VDRVCLEPKSKDLDMNSIQQPMDLGMGNLRVPKFGITNSKCLFDGEEIRYT